MQCSALLRKTNTRVESLVDHLANPRQIHLWTASAVFINALVAEPDTVSDLDVVGLLWHTEP